MIYRNALWAALLGLVAGIHPALAPAADPTVKQAFMDAAKALGMVRGVQRSLEVVNVIEYTAGGTMADANGAPAKVNRITAGYDYVIPAARLDIERVAGDGSVQRTIQVAAADLSWDESTPGIFLRPGASPAAARLRQIWLLPHGVILAGAKALERISMLDKGAQKEFSIPLPDGSQARAIVGDKNFMTHVEFNNGNELLSGDYADYKDYQDYGVMFPSRIVQKVDGRMVADLTVTESLANPYMIFPPPKELQRK